jgi:transcriptional regulator with XRE-family HTH domain
MTVRFDTERSLLANIDLGTRLKRLRTRQALSQKDLAGMVGVTPSTISQIESNLIYPFLPALFKMAQILTVDAGYFFQRDISGRRPMVFSGGGKEVRFPDLPKESIRGRHLLPVDLPAPLEPYLIEIPSGMKLPNHFFIHKGEEFGYLMEGELQVTVQNTVQQLSVGDVICLTRHIPSQWKNSGQQTAKLLCVKIL